MLNSFTKTPIWDNTCPYSEVYYTKKGLFRKEIHYRCKITGLTIQSPHIIGCYKQNSNGNYRHCSTYYEYKNQHR